MELHIKFTFTDLYILLVRVKNNKETKGNLKEGRVSNQQDGYRIHKQYWHGVSQQHGVGIKPE